MSTPAHKRSTDYKVGDSLEWQGMRMTKTRDVIPFIQDVQAEEIELWQTLNKSLFSPTLSFVEGSSLPDFFPVD